MGIDTALDNRDARFEPQKCSRFRSQGSGHFPQLKDALREFVEGFGDAGCFV